MDEKRTRLSMPETPAAIAQPEPEALDETELNEVVGGRNPTFTPTCDFAPRP